MAQYDRLMTLLLLRDAAVDPDRLATAEARMAAEPARTSDSYADVMVDAEIISRERLEALFNELQELLERHGWDEASASTELRGTIDAGRLKRFSDRCAELAARRSLTHVSGAFEEGELHARGGLGIVWRVRERATGRKVALKVMRPEFASDDGLLRRFLAEGRITAQLEHANIVPVYQVHEQAAKGTPFYVMRFVEGETLAEALNSLRDTRNRGRDAWRTAVRALIARFLRACEAVAYAHSRGVLHRDIKPANIMLGEFGDVFLLDWGLAKWIDEPPEGGSSREIVGGNSSETQPGQQLGTPLWMAPEQAKGAIERIDRRTDVYGLGATLFHLVTGEPPHAARDAETLDLLLARVASEPARRVRDVEPFVSGSLDAICGKAMAYDSGDRYQSVEELNADLERWLNGAAVSVHQEPWQRRMARRIVASPNRSVALASFAVVVGVCLATAAIAVFVGHAASNARAVEQLQERAEDAATELTRNVDRMTLELRFLAALPNVGEILTEATPSPSTQQAIDTIGRFVKERRDYPGVALVAMDQGKARVVRFIEAPEAKVEYRSLKSVMKTAAWERFIQSAMSLPEDGFRIASPFKAPADPKAPSQRLFHVGVPVRDHDRTLGVLWTLVDPKERFESVFGSAVYFERIVALDQRGDTLFRLDPSDPATSRRRILRILPGGRRERLVTPPKVPPMPHRALKDLPGYPKIVAFIEDRSSKSIDLLIDGRIAAFARKLPLTAAHESHLVMVILADMGALLEHWGTRRALLIAEVILLVGTVAVSLFVGRAVIRVARGD